MKTTKDVKRILTATMNTLNVVAGFCGLALGVKGHNLYAVLELGNQNDLMVMEAVALGVFGTIAAMITLGCGFWLNSGSNEFKVKMCGVMGFIALALASLRGVFPKYENTINKNLHQAVQSYYKDGSSSATNRRLVDNLHAQYGCCGYLGLEDFSKNENLPKSCCTELRLIEGKCTRHRARKIPCMTKINKKIETEVTWLKILSFVTPCVLNGLVLIMVIMVFMYKDHIPTATKIKWYY